MYLAMRLLIPRSKIIRKVRMKYSYLIILPKEKKELWNIIEQHEGLETYDLLVKCFTAITGTSIEQMQNEKDKEEKKELRIINTSQNNQMKKKKIVIKPKNILEQVKNTPTKSELLGCFPNPFYNFKNTYKEFQKLKKRVIHLEKENQEFKKRNTELQKRNTDLQKRNTKLENDFQERISDLEKKLDLALKDNVRLQKELKKEKEKNNLLLMQQSII